MPPATMTLSGKRYIVLPEREYRELKARAGNGAARSTSTHSKAKTRRPTKQDLGDIAESKRRMAEPSVPFEQVRARLGL